MKTSQGPLCQKKQNLPQISEPKVIALGKSSGFQSRGSVNQTPPNNKFINYHPHAVNQVTHSAINTHIIPHSFANTIVHSFFPPPCASGPLMQMALPVDSLPPVKIVSRQIGRPIQIKIPTSQLMNLQLQIKELRQKCQKLQQQTKSSSKNTQQEEIKNTFLQISKSTKIISEQLENAMNKADNNAITSNSQGFNNNKMDDSQQLSQQQFQEVIKSIQATSSKISELQAKNMQLEQNLMIKTQEMQKIKKQNVELKKKLQQKSGQPK